MSDEPKLYRVHVEAIAYVLAATAEEAEYIAVDHAFESDMPTSATASLNRSQLADPAWAKSEPYCGEDGRTVAEIIAAYVPDQQDMERAGQMRLEEQA